MANKYLPKMKNPPPPPARTKEGEDWQRYADGLKSDLNTICYYTDRLQRHFNQVLIIFSVKVIFDILLHAITLYIRHNTP
jgi:hypothetical protein